MKEIGTIVFSIGMYFLGISVIVFVLDFFLKLVVDKEKNKKGDKKQQ